MIGDCVRWGPARAPPMDMLAGYACEFGESRLNGRVFYLPSPSPSTHRVCTEGLSKFPPSRPSGLTRAFLSEWALKNFYRHVKHVLLAGTGARSARIECVLLLLSVNYWHFLYFAVKSVLLFPPCLSLCFCPWRLSPPLSTPYPTRTPYPTSTHVPTHSRML